jgi:hypothetical protein
MSVTEKEMAAAIAAARASGACWEAAMKEVVDWNKRLAIAAPVAKEIIWAALTSQKEEKLAALCGDKEAEHRHRQLAARSRGRIAYEVNQASSVAARAKDLDALWAERLVGRAAEVEKGHSRKSVLSWRWKLLQWVIDGIAHPDAVEADATCHLEELEAKFWEKD